MRKVSALVGGMSWIGALVAAALFILFGDPTRHTRFTVPWSLDSGADSIVEIPAPNAESAADGDTPAELLADWLASLRPGADGAAQPGDDPATRDRRADRILPPGAVIVPIPPMAGGTPGLEQSPPIPHPDRDGGPQFAGILGGGPSGIISGGGGSGATGAGPTGSGSAGAGFPAGPLFAAGGFGGFGTTPGGSQSFGGSAGAAGGSTAGNSTTGGNGAQGAGASAGSAGGATGSSGANPGGLSSTGQGGTQTGASGNGQSSGSNNASSGNGGGNGGGQTSGSTPSQTADAGGGGNGGGNGGGQTSGSSNSPTGGNGSSGGSGNSNQGGTGGTQGSGAGSGGGSGSGGGGGGGAGTGTGSGGGTGTGSGGGTGTGTGGGTGAQLVAGQTAQNPIMPYWQSGGSWWLSVNNCMGADCNGWQFFDPTVAVGYDYQLVSSDPTKALDFGITEIQVPTVIGDGIYEFYLFDILNGQWFDTGQQIDANPNDDPSLEFNVVAYLDTLDQTTLAEFGLTDPLLGITQFSLRGIDPAAGIDPNDPGAFVTGLLFTDMTSFDYSNGRNGDLIITPVTVDPPDVPEPSSLAVFATGLLAFVLLGGWRRRGSR